MGAYIYRLKGTKAYEEFIIDGKKERVYDYVFWYKPYNDMWGKEPKWMRPIKMLDARLKNAFEKLPPVKWCRHVGPDGSKDSEIMEWPTHTIAFADYGERYQNARRIPISDLT
jgi:hypothetical protein